VLLTLPDGRDALVSEHALERWHELVCPLRPEWWAVALLSSVVDMAGALTDEPPAWVSPERETMQSYLVAGDFLFIVAPRRSGGFIVVTTIARGELPRTIRQARNHANKVKRRTRAARRRPDIRGRDRSRLRDLRAPIYDGLTG
jgi:hypothetical protein